MNPLRIFVVLSWVTFALRQIMLKPASRPPPHRHVRQKEKATPAICSRFAARSEATLRESRCPGPIRFGSRQGRFRAGAPQRDVRFAFLANRFDMRSVNCLAFVRET